MRILHINCNYILSSLHQCLIERLNNEGVENDVFVATYDKKRSIVNTKEYVKVEECFEKWDRICFDYKQSKILKCIKNTYNINNFDCIHAYTLFTDGNSAMKLSQQFGIPFVVAVRNTDVNDFFAKRVFLKNRGIEIMRKASYIFFLSESYKNQVFEKYIPSRYHEELLSKTCVVPNGIDDFWINNMPSYEHEDINTNNVIQLIYAGRIDKNKNIPTIQAAMNILRKKGIKTELEIVGRVEDGNEFKKICKDNYTHYIKALPKEKLLREYRQSDIFVMPSFTESFGLVYAEAMSQGIPVLYSKGQGFDRQFEEGLVGYNVDSKSAKSVAEGIEKVICNYATIKRNVVKCSHEFDWSKIAKVYCKIYNSLECYTDGN